jgi:hypothetical protein
VPPVKSYTDFKKDVLKAFANEFPGEQITSQVFSTWLLAVHCELLERYGLYKELIRNKE